MLGFTFDYNARPRNPWEWAGWAVEEHHQRNVSVSDILRVEFYLALGQKSGDGIEGHEVRKKLAKDVFILNANVLDHWLAYRNLIPQECKRKRVYFWGTIYRAPDARLYVRYLEWRSGTWYGDSGNCLDDFWRRNSPAVCLPN